MTRARGRVDELRARIVAFVAAFVAVVLATALTCHTLGMRPSVAAIEQFVAFLHYGFGLVPGFVAAVLVLLTSAAVLTMAASTRSVLLGIAEAIAAGFFVGVAFGALGWSQDAGTLGTLLGGRLAATMTVPIAAALACVSAILAIWLVVDGASRALLGEREAVLHPELALAGAAGSEALSRGSAAPSQATAASTPTAAPRPGSSAEIPRGWIREVIQRHQGSDPLALAGTPSAAVLDDRVTTGSVRLVPRHRPALEPNSDEPSSSREAQPSPSDVEPVEAETVSMEEESNPDDETVNLRFTPSESTHGLDGDAPSASADPQARGMAEELLDDGAARAEGEESEASARELLEYAPRREVPPAVAVFEAPASVEAADLSMAMRSSFEFVPEVEPQEAVATATEEFTSPALSETASQVPSHDESSPELLAPQGGAEETQHGHGTSAPTRGGCLDGIEIAGEAPNAEPLAEFVSGQRSVHIDLERDGDRRGVDDGDLEHGLRNAGGAAPDAALDEHAGPQRPLEAGAEAHTEAAVAPVQLSVPPAPAWAEPDWSVELPRTIASEPVAEDVAVQNVAEPPTEPAAPEPAAPPVATPAPASAEAVAPKAVEAEPTDPPAAASAQGTFTFEAPASDAIRLDRAARLVIQDRRASMSYLQRKLEVSFNEAQRLLSELERIGVVGPYLGHPSREIRMTLDDWNARSAGEAAGS